MALCDANRFMKTMVFLLSLPKLPPLLYVTLVLFYCAYKFHVPSVFRFAMCVFFFKFHFIPFFDFGRNIMHMRSRTTNARTCYIICRSKSKLDIYSYKSAQVQLKIQNINIYGWNTYECRIEEKTERNDKRRKKNKI